MVAGLGRSFHGSTLLAPAPASPNGPLMIPAAASLFSIHGTSLRLQSGREETAALLMGVPSSCMV